MDIHTYTPRLTVVLSSWTYIHTHQGLQLYSAHGHTYIHTKAYGCTLLMFSWKVHQLQGRRARAWPHYEALIIRTQVLFTHLRCRYPQLSGGMRDLKLIVKFKYGAEYIFHSIYIYIYIHVLHPCLCVLHVARLSRILHTYMQLYMHTYIEDFNYGLAHFISAFCAYHTRPFWPPPASS